MGFRLLLDRGAPVAVEDLAQAMKSVAPVVDARLRHWVRRGAARVDGERRLVAIAGSSVVWDRHEIAVAGHRYWTWCAFDAVGILAALQADGVIRSRDPQSSTPMELAFRAGRPADGAAVLFMPSAGSSSCASVIDEWCPNANLFENRAAAQAWAREHGVDGRVLELDEAAALGAASWRPLLPIQVDFH